MSIKNASIKSIQDAIALAISDLTNSKAEVSIKSLDVSGELTGKIFEEQTANLTIKITLVNANDSLPESF